MADVVINFPITRSIVTNPTFAGTCDTRRVWAVGGINFPVTRSLTTELPAGSTIADTSRVWVGEGLNFPIIRGLRNSLSNTTVADTVRIFRKDLISADPFDIPIILRCVNLNFSWITRSAVTMAWCWYLKRIDGTILGFTSHDRDILYQGVTYKASSGFIPTAVESTNSLSVDNLDVEGFLSSENITPHDLMLGKFDFAEFYYFICNWADLSTPTIILRRGTLGRIARGDNKFTVELRGMLEPFQQTKGLLYQKPCRASFGDSKCKLAASSYTTGRNIISISDDGAYVHSGDVLADHTFDYGIIRFTTGYNAGMSYEIKTSIGNKLYPYLPPAYPVAIGDGISITWGCDKNFSTCRDRYANYANFRGEPDIPGVDYITTYVTHGKTTGADVIIVPPGTVEAPSLTLTWYATSAGENDPVVWWYRASTNLNSLPKPLSCYEIQTWATNYETDGYVGTSQENAPWIGGSAWINSGEDGYCMVFQLKPAYGYTVTDIQYYARCRLISADVNSYSNVSTGKVPVNEGGGGS